MSGEDEPVDAIGRALGILEAAMEVVDDPRQIVEYVKAIEALHRMRPQADVGGPVLSIIHSDRRHSMVDHGEDVEFVLRRVPPREGWESKDEQGEANGEQGEIKDGDEHD